MLKFNVCIQDMVLKEGKIMSHDFLVEECSRFDVRMVARCGGLVTTSGIPPPKSLPASKEGRKLLAESITQRIVYDRDIFFMSFGHRSAADFLLSTSTSQEILNYDRTSEVEHFNLQAKAEPCYSILA
jgi:hypothetical protein